MHTQESNRCRFFKCQAVIEFCSIIGLIIDRNLNFDKLFFKNCHKLLSMAKLSMILKYLIQFAFIYMHLTNALKEGECEVCVGVLDKLISSLSDAEKSSVPKIESKFKNFCLSAKKSENRFCYYLGGLEESATKIVAEMSKPLSWGLPSDKICEKLKKKDVQICELRYEKTIDLKTVDLKKLKVRELKKILSDWDERCDGCLEKSDFIKRIEELKPKYSREEL